MRQEGARYQVYCSPTEDGQGRERQTGARHRRRRNATSIQTEAIPGGGTTHEHKAWTVTIHAERHKLNAQHPRAPVNEFTLDEPTAGTK